MRGFLTRFALRGRDPAVADENLYRYCGDGPMGATDPTGMADVGLTVSTLRPAVPLDDYGMTMQQARFAVADKTANGWIIQRVRVTYRVYKNGQLFGSNVQRPGEFWEAWQVVNGTIYAGRKNTLGTNVHHADTWGIPGFGRGSEGGYRIEGWIMFYPSGSAVDPGTWGQSKSATSPLPTTYTLPKGWQEPAAPVRELEDRWCDWPRANVPALKTQIVKDLPK
jgi:hypothetical protein